MVVEQRCLVAEDVADLADVHGEVVLLPYRKHAVTPTGEFGSVMAGRLSKLGLAGIHKLNAGRDAAVTYLVVAALVTVLMTVVHVDLPVLGAVGPAAVAMLFLYAPMQVGTWRGEVIEDYGFHADPMRRGLMTAGVAIAIAFPIFIAVYLGVLRGRVPRRGASGR